MGPIPLATPQEAPIPDADVRKDKHPCDVGLGILAMCTMGLLFFPGWLILAAPSWIVGKIAQMCGYRPKEEPDDWAGCWF